MNSFGNDTMEDILFILLGVIAGILILTGWVAQIYRGYKTKNLRDVSKFLMIFILAGATLWLIYGIIVADIYIVGTNVAAMILMGMVLGMKRRYDRLRPTQIKHIMQRNVVTINLEQTLLDAARVLQEKKISFLVIMNNDKPVGLITERDIVSVVSDSKNTTDIPLNTIMTKDFVWVEPDTSINSAIEKMIDNRIRRLIVLDDGELVGVVTPTNFREFAYNIQ